jgi:glycosyltransferase involved in cell wall biosynthesis
MRIVIALASHSAHISGIERHAINLARALLLQDEIQQVHLVGAPWQQELLQSAFPIYDAKLFLHEAQLGRSAWQRNMWYCHRLPEIAAQLCADVVHLAYPMPLKRRAFRCPTVVSLHDLYPYAVPENFGFPKVFVNRFVLRHCLKAVQAVACVSRSTYFDLYNLDPQLAQSKACIIPNSVEAQTSVPLIDIESRWGDGPFLLCVAQHRRNKNILLALRIFRRLLRESRIPSISRLIVIGITGPETPRIKHFIASSRLADRVVMESGLSDVELQWLYRTCEVLLAPSTAEGFGLPVVEALLAGCRVVCSNIPAHQEFGGDHCHFVSMGPGDEDRFMQSTLTVLQEMKPAPVALPNLSPNCIGQSFLDLYRNLVLHGITCQPQPSSLPIQSKGHALP